MAETLRPNLTMPQKQRLPMSARIQSPTAPFFLGSNDDQLECAQARAAGAAALRSKSVAANLQFRCVDANCDPCLNKQQILDLFHNCIKLASENKINQKNTWELNLIDHLTVIIKAEVVNDTETNFQMTLLWTVLMLKVDKKTEGERWTKRMLFDSQEVPGKCMVNQNQHDISDPIDLSFVKDCVEQLVLNMRVKDEISPTLRTLVNQFNENNRRPSDFQFSGQKSAEEFDAAIGCEIGADTEEYENCMSWNDHYDQTVVSDLGSNDPDSSFPCYPQENDQCPSQDPDVDERFENVDGYLFLSLGFSSKKNGWAGPDHWKYRKATVSELHPTSEDGSTLKTRQPKTKRQVEIDLDFTNFLEKQMPCIFSPPKNPKSLLLPENRPPSNAKLPQDCHYQLENLVELFLLPNVKCLGRRAKFSDCISNSAVFVDGSREQCNNYESFPSWDNGSVCDGEYEGDAHSDMDDSSTLISQPRQINKIEVQYDKTSKQVDVQALKVALWDNIQESVQVPFQGQKEMVSFKQILANFPSECNAAATVSDISPHLCLICLLHLANKKGLSIRSCPNLDGLRICLPDVGATICGIK